MKADAIPRDQALESRNAEEMAQRADAFHVLAEVAKSITVTLDLPDLLDAAMHKLADVLDPSELGVIMLWDDPAGLFRPAAAFGYDLREIREMGLRAGESLTGKVFDADLPRLLDTSSEIADVMSDMRPSNRLVMARALGTTEFPHSVLAVPLRVGDRKFGVLVLEILRRPTHFSAPDLVFVATIADLIALAIDRDRLEKGTAAARDAHEIDRIRSEALATLSHELRTPLATIKGYSTALLLEEVTWTDDKRREFLQLIDSECDNLTAMINDVLDSSLIDVGRLVIEREPVRLPRLIREIADEMQTLTSIHRFVLDLPADLPIVDVDPRRIKQIIRNILDNSIKYSPEGGLIVIRGQARHSDIVVSISDQGVGISQEDLIPLFEKYFRVKSPTGYHVAGTGLGLPVARALVEAHGGRIWAESKVSQGTTLYFSLPLSSLST